MTQFKEAIHSAGIKPPEKIEDDGRLHRFSTNGKNGNVAGWYILHGDGIPAGCFGDWRTGITQYWRANIGRKLTLQEECDYKKKMEFIALKREAEERKRQAGARERAMTLFEKAIVVSNDHPYLKEKSIKAYGARDYKGTLVVPIYIDEILHSLQFISPNGSKHFLPGGRVNGGYFTIGKPEDSICVCEGYATGASIFEATGHSVAIAFNAGNLESVARFLRQKYPNVQLIICADDDIATEGNPGITKARKAALRVGGLLAIPDFGNNRPQGVSDFNDLYRCAGIEVVKRCINNAKEQINQKDLTTNGNETIKSAVELICGTDLEPKPIHWIWNNWLAAGKFHILAGAPGTGKTTIALNLAATITRGGQWPDGTKSELGSVLIWSGEDDPKDTLLPRLLAQGADRSRIFFISNVNENNKQRSFDPSKDIDKLREQALKISDVRLIIVDPVVNAVSGDSHKNVEVRRDLQPLVELGERLQTVVLGISHFTKETAGRDPLERVTGSIAFGALARVVLATAKITDNNGQSKRLFVRAKSNNGPDGGGFNYTIEHISLTGYNGVCTSKVVWGESVDGTARELLIDTNDQWNSDDRSALIEAQDFLKAELADGPLSQKEIERRAKNVGIKSATLRRAKSALGIEANRHGFGAGSTWEWHLPSKVITLSKDAHTQNVVIFDGNDHLRLKNIQSKESQTFND